VIFGSNLTITVSSGISPIVAFPVEANWSISSLPSDVQLTVTGALGLIDPINLIFGVNQSISSLNVSDPVRLVLPEQSSITIDRFMVDYRSFKRFFKPPGVLSNSTAVKINQLFLDETSRYHELQVLSNGWGLIGNEDAWNTTLPLPNTSFTILTHARAFSVAADVPILSSSLGLILNTEDSELTCLLSFLNIYNYNNQTFTLSSPFRASLIHPYRVFPASFFLLSSTIALEYVPPDEGNQLCFYSSLPTECSIGFNPISATSYPIPPGSFAIIELHKTVTFLLTDNSPPTIEINGNGSTFTLDRQWIRDSLLSTTSFKFTNAILNPGFGSISIADLRTDYPSLSSITDTIQVINSLNIQGSAVPATSQTGRPIIFADTNTQISNLELLPTVSLISETSFSLSNSRATWTIEKVSPGQPLNINLSSNLTVASVSQKVPSLDFLFSQSHSSLHVTSGWTETKISVRPNSMDFFNLILDSPAPLTLADDGHFIVSPTTLRYIDFTGVKRASVIVESSLGIDEIRIGEVLVDVVNTADIPRREFIGQLVFRHTVNRELLIGIIDGTVKISPEIVIELTSEGNLRIVEEWVKISPEVKLTIKGEGTVIVEGSVLPAAISVENSITVQFDSGKLSSGAIVGIVIGGIALIGIVIGIGLWWRGNKKFDYDMIPDGQGKETSMVADELKVTL
jgi:hypothetical protein